MSVEKKENFKDSHFVIEFLLDANLHSYEGIEEVPDDYVEKHLKNIKSYIKEAKQKSLDTAHELTFLTQGSYRNTTQLKKVWSHKSVKALIEESGNEDNPVEIIKNKARKVVLQALEDGWNGPPYSAIELARILNYDIAPNDTVLDARTIASKRGKILIEYNPFQKPTRMNFSIAHEIAHTLFSDFQEEIRNREDKPIENRELEQLCNIGAAEFQLPYVIFPADANEIQNITLSSLVELANRYKSSIESLLNSFVLAIQRTCAVLFFTFQDDNQLTLDYFKTSNKFNLTIPDNFVLPIESKGYYCSTAGTSQSETVTWSFLDEPYDIFYIGISPIRKDNKARIAALLVPNDGKEFLQNKKIVINYGDATKPIGEGRKIIAQVVNTSAGLGSGFGKSLSKNYPVIIHALKSWKENKSKFRLGESQLISVKNDVYVFQMLAQNGLYAKKGKSLLDYVSLQKCLDDLRETALELNADVHMPLIGAGNAKGDWNIIEGMIYTELINQNVKVHIYLWGTKKPGGFNPRESLSLFNEESTWQKEK